MLFEIIVSANLESPEYFCIFPLYLAIASGMCHRSIAELDADALAILLKVPALELGPVDGDDTIRDPELAHNGLEKCDG
jgi:hypothetical protein